MRIDKGKDKYEGFVPVIINQEDKEYVRDNILTKIAESNQDKVIKQFEQCITIIAIHDYPKRWGILVDEIKEMLASTSTKQNFAGLTALKGLVRKYNLI